MAYLKARVDAGDDHLDMFLPLVVDAAAQFDGRTFVAQEVQEAVAAHYGLAMPQHTVAALLNRAKRRGLVQREYGRYKMRPGTHDFQDVTAERSRVESDIHLLSQQLRVFASEKGVALDTDEAAGALLFDFLERQQVGLLLGSPPSIRDTSGAGRRHELVVAEFVQAAMSDATTRHLLGGVLEGMVLYNAAFLPDLTGTNKKFEDLRVYFDSGLVREALGYEGTASQVLIREVLDLLKAGGVQCLVFDKTVDEIRRILAMYERKLATPDGRRSLRPGAMARHFLTQRYTPADVLQMAALLDRDISAAGFQTCQTPPHLREYTLDEKSLTECLSDPETRDESEPRVVHDVDCVAAILTLRRGRRSSTLEKAKAVFATGSGKVVRNAGIWFRAQGESGVAPAVHIRALSNQAWLKRPALVAEFKLREMVTLCAAALRPSRNTWSRFLRHLEKLQQSGAVTSDEATAIIVSALSDKLLQMAELEDAEADGLDAHSLDAVVERVKESYAEEAARQVAEMAADRDAAVSAANAARDAAVEAARKSEEEAVTSARSEAAASGERLREMQMRIEGRAQRLGRAISWTVFGLVGLVACAGAVAVALGHGFKPGWVNVAVASAVAIFVVLELAGVLGHLKAARARFAAWLVIRARTWLGGG